MKAVVRGSFIYSADPRLEPLHGQPEFAALKASLPAMGADAAQGGERSEPAQ